MTVLLAGLPRSRTTWVAKILDSHPDVLYRHEPDSGARVRDIPLFPISENVAEERASVACFIDDLAHMRDIRTTGKMPIFRKRFLPGWRGVARTASVYASKAAASWINIPVWEPVVRQPDCRMRILWKSIESTGRLGLIVAAVPGIRVVHLVRHPCGQIHSVMRGEAAKKFSGGVAASDDWPIYEMLLNTRQAARLGSDMKSLKEAHPVERLAWRWAVINEKALDGMDGHAHGHLMLYEDICADPMEQARKLVRFSGLEWNPAVARFVDASTSGRSADYYSVIRNTVAEAWKWQQGMDGNLVERILAVVRPTRPGSLYMDGVP